MAQPKHVRTLHDRLKIIEEVEKNPGEKRVDIAKPLGLSASTLNSIFAKKDEIRQQIEKCGNACKKRKTGKESTFAEFETVLFTFVVAHFQVIPLSQQRFSSGQNEPLKKRLLRPCHRGVSVVKNVYVYRVITVRNDCIFSFL